MIFVSRFVVTVGVLFASARDFSSRSHPSDYASLTSWSPVVSTAAWVRGHSVTSALNVNPSALVSRFVASRRRVKRPRLSLPPERSFVKHPLTLAPPPSLSTFLTEPNFTRPENGSSSQSVVLTVPPYNGPKDLACRDDRRALVVHGYAGSRELAVYWRPSSLVVYTGLANSFQFWVDPSHYELVTRVYRPRFVTNGYMANKYGHLDPTDFERCAIDNPIDVLLEGNRPRLLQSLGFIPPQYITIGRSERQLEERVAWTLAYLYAFGFLLILATTVSEEYIELQKALVCRQPATLASSSDNQRDLFALPGIVYSAPCEVSEQKAEDNWWKAGQQETRSSEYSASTFLELPVITKLDLTPANSYTSPSPSASTNVQTSAEVPRDTSAPSHPPKSLTARPSGPRFKTAAWRRCRTK